MNTPSLSNKPSVGILGGGITGLTAAYYLLRSGARVTVVEAAPTPGGLATYFAFGEFYWDKFYHCILTSDAPLRTLIQDLGLADQMRWTETKVGFYADGALYSMSSTLDFLRFPPLSLWQKFRLGLGILYASRIRDGGRLERLPVTDWLVRVFGQANYEKMWKPLLKCKLGTCREEASAAFIWATIFRLYSTRDRGAGQNERLGYVTGGYRTVFSRLVEEIERLGGTIHTGQPVQRIEGRRDSGVDLVTPQGRLRFDAAIATLPSHVFSAITPGLSADYVRRLNAIKYLGIVCVVLVLKRPLTAFYCTNLTADDIPFTGIIEMTNLISRQETRGRHLVYLPKYTGPGDPLMDMTDDDVWSLFGSQLQKIFPDFRASDIERRFVFRERLVQPLPVLNYSEIVPPMETGIPNLMLANTTQIINSTLNNNEMVKIARTAAERVEKSLAARPKQTSVAAFQ